MCNNAEARILLKKGHAVVHKVHPFTKNLPRQKNFFGFQTGDIVKANVVKGKKAGSYYGRVAVRSSGYFNIQEKNKTTQGIKYTNCKIIQRSDGYGYNLKEVEIAKEV